MTAAFKRRLIGQLAWVHCWSSVALCLLLTVWFASGMVMLFEPFPSLSEGERLAGAQPLAPERLRVQPEGALALVPAATSLRVLMRDGRPVYVATQDRGGLVVMDGEHGRQVPALETVAATRIARTFMPGARVVTVAKIEFDQWVVHQGFDAPRPYYRVALDDPAHTSLYVSQLTGEVVQRTTRRQRFFGTAGAVLHWIYFTPLRKHWSLWDQTVWWTSLFALVGATAGFAVGLIRFALARQHLGHGFRAFRGLWRWHHVLGLSVGMFVLTWILSGWLSMDHGRLFSVSLAGIDRQEDFRARSLASAAADLNTTDLPTLASPKELRLGVVAGQSFWLARDQGSSMIRFANGSQAARIESSLLASAVQAAWPDQRIRPLPGTRLSEFYARADDLGMNSQGFEALPQSTLVYVSSLSGEIDAVIDASRRRYAWLYYGLHTWRFPGTDHMRGIRLTAMTAALSVGLALSVSGVILAWRKLRPRREAMRT